MRKSLFLLSSILALAMFANSTRATTLLSDNFSSGFNTSSIWQALPNSIVSGSAPGYFGLPQSALPQTISGQQVETFTSFFNYNNQFTGFESQATFNGLPSATLDVKFYTTGGIDTLLGVGISGASNSEFIGLFAGNFGASRSVYTGSSIYTGNSENFSSTSWQFDTFYQFVVSSTAHSSILSFEDSLGDVLYTTTVPLGLTDFGSNIKILVEQGVNTPGQAEQTSASIQQVVLTSTVPEPASLTLLGVAAISLLRCRRF
jgi:hypothetical protein